MIGALNKQIIHFIKSQFPGQDSIPLHAPVFKGNEKNYLNDALDSTYVSSVGEYVNRFEIMMAQQTDSNYAVALVNGTNALHIAMLVCGVERGNEVLTQALTFIATANAIAYIGADPVFIDVDSDTAGMSPTALEIFLIGNAEKRNDGFSYNKRTGKKISACIPMHTFGLPGRIDEVKVICDHWNIVLIEDAAESLGSYYKGKHTGNFGKVGVFSFNGNKTITCGGGGALITNDENLAKRAKHLTTQAKVPHKWEFVHDEIGYNYRMPNLNAALACAQLEQLSRFVQNKRELAAIYHQYFDSINQPFLSDITDAKSNYWLNALIFKNIESRNSFLEESNNNGVMTRPVWQLMNRLPMFKKAERGALTNSEWIADRLVNIPSSVRDR
ncbi:MAG: LegC family aminotransferase [Flavobacterium sp.]|nr:LegC family aminotransferase [Pedobacter sp.]